MEWSGGVALARRCCGGPEAPGANARRTGTSLPGRRDQRGTTPYCGQVLKCTALVDQLLAPVMRP